MPDADHEESSPGTSSPLISKLHCSLAGQMGTVKLVAGSRAQEIYGCEETIENFACNYGVNPLYRDRLRSEELIVSGYDEDGAIRIVELKSRLFFIATLFMPQLKSSEEVPNPLLVAYLRAAEQNRTAKRNF